MAAHTTIQAVKGTRDFYPDVMAFRSWLYGQVRALSERFGYQEYEAPILERLELYAAKSGEELVKEQAFVLKDRGGEELALRAELTPSLARMVAQHQGRLVLPVRWFSYGPFWRYERPQRGRTREFFQWNIDLIGCDAPSADGELVSIGALFLQQVGLQPGEVGVLINSRRLLDEKLAGIGIAPERRHDVLQLVDRRAKTAPATWEARALKIGLAARQLDALKAILANSELWRESEALCQVFATAQALGVADYVTYDAGVVRGLDYYTGVVFEAFDRRRELRSIFGGGRYDNLVADVGGEPISAVGMAMGDAVIEVLLDRAGRRPELPPTPSRVLVTLFSAELYGPTLALATRLRQAGINAEQVLEPDRLGRQLRIADRKGIPYALILGPDELASGQVILKELATGEQLVCLPAEAIARLAAG